MIYVITSRSLAEKLKHLLNLIPELKPRLEIELISLEGKSIYELDLDTVSKVVNAISSAVSQSFKIVVVPFTVTNRVKRVKDALIVPLKNLPDIIALAYYLQENPYINENIEIRDIELRLLELKRLCEDIAYSCRGRLAKIRGILGTTCRRALTGLPPLILAEIIDATQRRLDEVKSIAERYVSEGASGVDIGCVSGHPRPDRVREIAYLLRREFPDILLSIDTFSVQEIEAALPYIDIVLSFTPSGLQNCQLDLSDRGVVVIPDVADENVLMERFKLAVNEALDKRRCVPILDPLLRPPIFGLSRSIYLYYKIRQEFPDVPLFMGLGNVTELIDADSTGVNAVLAVLTVELEVDLVLTTEASTKTRYCVRELNTALYMATVAKILGKYPKDMSRSLLVSKSKY